MAQSSASGKDSSDEKREEAVFDHEERVPTRRVVLTLLATWAATVGVFAAFAGYLFSTRLLLDSSGIYSSAPAGRLLLISTITSRTTLIVFPMLVTLFAFKIGAIWMKSRDENDGDNESGTDSQGVQKPSTFDNSRLTPLQFECLAAMCSTAGLLSIFRALSSSFVSSTGGNLLRAALRTILPLFILAYAISIVEGVWLHAVTLPTLLPINSLRPSSENLQLSRSIDSFCQQNPVYTDCDGQQVLACSLKYLGNSCTNTQDSVVMLRGSDEAVFTASNISTTHTVHLVSEKAPSSPLGKDATPSTTTALLLPYLSSNTRSKISYKATTTGVRTTCENLTPFCNVTVAEPNDPAAAGSVLYDSCPGRPGLTQGIDEQKRALGPIAGWNVTEFDPSAVNSIRRGQKSNPFPVALAMIFDVDLQNETNTTTHQLLGGMLHTRGPTLFGLLWCNIEVLSPVTYRNDRGNIEILDAQRAPEGSPEVWAVSGGFAAAPLTAKLYTDAQSSPLTPAPNRAVSFTSAYSRSVSNILLSVSAGVHNSSSSLEERDVKMVQATHIPWSVLSVFFGLVFCYTAFATWVCWEVWRTARIVVAREQSNGEQWLDLAAKKLSEPATLVYDLTESKDRGGSGKELSGMRLRLGKKEDGDFGVAV